MAKDATLTTGEKLRWVRVTMPIIVSGFAFWFFYGAVIGVRGAIKKVTAHGQCRMIVAALMEYQKQIGTPPSGDHAAIMTALRGTNSKNVIFLGFDAKDFTARGEFFDPWGHPYGIDVSDAQHPHVYSFGKNGRDEDAAESSDDIVNWR